MRILERIRHFDQMFCLSERMLLGRERLYPMKQKLAELFAADQKIKQARRPERWQQLKTLTFFAIAAFLLMSLVNAIQHSYGMLVTTLGSAGILGLNLGQCWKDQHIEVMEDTFFGLLLLLFTGYILLGGSNGFALLWVVFIPFMFMTMIDLKKGLTLSIYFLLLLFLAFHGPFRGLMRFPYSETMRYRFPMLYLIDCVMSFYIVQRLVFDRYRLMDAQVQLRNASFVDAATGLQNRSSYTRFVEETDPSAFIRLSVIYIDVNGLHELNNRLGHAAGDEMLRFVAEACVKQFPQAHVFRLGGDEFLILCPVGTKEEVQRWVEQLNATVEAAGYTIACGVESRMDHFDIADMVSIADARMLANKADYYRARDRRKR